MSLSVQQIRMGNHCSWSCQVLQLHCNATFPYISYSSISSDQSRNFWRWEKICMDFIWVRPKKNFFSWRFVSSQEGLWCEDIVCISLSEMVIWLNEMKWNLHITATFLRYRIFCVQVDLMYWIETVLMVLTWFIYLCLLFSAESSGSVKNFTWMRLFFLLMNINTSAGYVGVCRERCSTFDEMLVVNFSDSSVALFVYLC